MQIKGCSSSKAHVIISSFPTPRHLIGAYEKLNNELEKKLMLSKLILPSSRSIGPVLSSAVYSSFYN